MKLVKGPCSASEAILRGKDLLQNPISQVQELNVSHCTNPAIPWGQLGLTIVSLLCTHKKFIKAYLHHMHAYIHVKISSTTGGEQLRLHMQSKTGVNNS